MEPEHNEQRPKALGPELDPQAFLSDFETVLLERHWPSEALRVEVARLSKSACARPSWNRWARRLRDSLRVEAYERAARECVEQAYPERSPQWQARQLQCLQDVWRRLLSDPAWDAMRFALVVSAIVAVSKIDKRLKSEPHLVDLARLRDAAFALVHDGELKLSRRLPKWEKELIPLPGQGRGVSLAVFVATTIAQEFIALLAGLPYEQVLEQAQENPAPQDGGAPLADC